MNVLNVIDKSLREVLIVDSIYQSNKDFYFQEKSDYTLLNRLSAIRHDDTVIILEEIFKELGISLDENNSYTPITATNVFLNTSNDYFINIFNSAYNSCLNQDIVDNQVVKLVAIAFEIRNCLNKMDYLLAA